MTHDNLTIKRTDKGYMLETSDGSHLTGRWHVSKDEDGYAVLTAAKCFGGKKLYTLNSHHSNWAEFIPCLLNGDFDCTFTP